MNQPSHMKRLSINLYVGGLIHQESTWNGTLAPETNMNGLLPRWSSGPRADYSPRRLFAPSTSTVSEPVERHELTQWNVCICTYLYVPWTAFKDHLNMVDLFDKGYWINGVSKPIGKLSDLFPGHVVQNFPTKNWLLVHPLTALIPQMDWIVMTNKKRQLQKEGSCWLSGPTCTRQLSDEVGPNLWSSEISRESHNRKRNLMSFHLTCWLSF